MNFELEIGFPLGLGGKQIFRVILFVPLLTSFLHLSGREREEKGEGGRINGFFFSLLFVSLTAKRPQGTFQYLLDGKRTVQS